MTEIAICLEDLKRLHKIALKQNTLEVWADISLSWMEAANEKLGALEERITNSYLFEEE